MIKNINFVNSRLLKFETQEDVIQFTPPLPYTRIYSFLELDDGFIVVLGWGIGEESSGLTEEKKGRNVVKINIVGEIVWQVADKSQIWAKRINEESPTKKESLDTFVSSPFDLVKKIEDKIVLVHSSDIGYFLNPETGEIEYWKTDRWGI